MIRFIALYAAPYEGLDTMGYGYIDEQETDYREFADDAIPTFATIGAAREFAKSQGWISPKGRRDDAVILAVAA